MINLYDDLVNLCRKQNIDSIYFHALKNEKGEQILYTDSNICQESINELEEIISKIEYSWCDGFIRKDINWIFGFLCGQNENLYDIEGYTNQESNFRLFRNDNAKNGKIAKQSTSIHDLLNCHAQMLPEGSNADYFIENKMDAGKFILITKSKNKNNVPWRISGGTQDFDRQTDGTKPFWQNLLSQSKIHFSF